MPSSRRALRSRTSHGACPRRGEKVREKVRPCIQATAPSEPTGAKAFVCLALRHHALEEMLALAILDLDDPRIGIEADRAPDPLLDLRLGHRRLAQAADEGTITRMGL